MFNSSNKEENSDHISHLILKQVWSYFSFFCANIIYILISWALNLVKQQFSLFKDKAKPCEKKLNEDL